MVVSVMQEAVVGDGLEDKRHIVADCQVVLEIPADQRVQQVRGCCLYDCSHFFVNVCIVIKRGGRSVRIVVTEVCVGRGYAQGELKAT